MSSTLGLPTRGSEVTINITRIHLHPLCVLVEFWGKFSQESTVDSECLAKDIQSPENAFQEYEGGPGDQCLVQIDGIWNRARIVSRNGSKYSLYLIDKGVTSCTNTSKLAWGKKEHFHLPPEVEFCVLANVLPLSTESRWSPVALEYLRSLSGKSLKAHVQDVLVAYRIYFVHIPFISKQMYEMGFAKKVSPDMFQEFVLMSLKSNSVISHQISMSADVRLHKQDQFMVPELPDGTVETVIVTEVTSPQKIFCQLKVFSQELKKLSEKLTKICEGRMTNCTVGPEMISFPCAAKGNDGRWHRSVLQQVFPANGVVEVFNVDCGTKQFVQVENVGPLASEFFRMPVVTYICSLHGIVDKGDGWTSSQIDLLRNLLLHKTVIAKFEYQSMSEGVNYVTLFGDENTNINKLFGSKESCLLECEKTLGDYAIRSPAYSQEHQAQQERSQRKPSTSPKAAEEKEQKGIPEKLPAEDLSINSSHVAVVQHVSNPSEFWIQTQKYAQELDELMDRIYHLHKDSGNKDVVRNPTVGLYCAAKAEDGVFYRAIVSEVGQTQVKVFFVDYGNTEVVKRMNIRTLPDKFKKLPRLALKCTLADVRPKDGRWSPCASDYFIKAVTDKALNVHVTAKYDDGYVVQLTDPEAHEERDLSTLMRTYNLTEKAETKRQPKANGTIQPAVLPSTQHPHDSGICLKQNTVGPAINERRIPSFKENMFHIGSVLDVSVSHIKSPNDFWCQLVSNAGHLKFLMHDIQAHYVGSEFQPVVETACVARHPDNGMWYRAIVIHKHEKPLVDVLFVDYGQTETISLYDLRRICPEFLTLPGQSFRCNLLNPMDPTSANEWNQEATARFHKFVETAASNFVILKCTIYAVMYSDQKIIFNIVDLETPFESVCTSMGNLVKSARPKKVSEPSVRLDSYYFSSHNVKTGTEEQITVTCVNNVNQFYCQLERNTDVMEDLKNEVSQVCHQLENVKLPGVLGALCFAKYTDGHWYRGQIQDTKPAIRVHFVDYGDTIEVAMSDLLPVPIEANAIMSVPVQAVLCGLSDVPAQVPSEANSWFETCATESKFQAVVVAREPDGKLLVELYQGGSQINSKIKKKFQIEMHTNEQVVNRRAIPPKTANQIRDDSKSTNTNLQSAPKPLGHVNEHGQKVKAVPLQLYQPPHQRQSCGTTLRNMGNGYEPACAQVRPNEENIRTDTDQLIKSISPGADSRVEGHVEKLPKLADLPLTSITPGMEAEVYVSHYHSPSSFHVQLFRDEDEIFSISEKLNDSISITKNNDVKVLNPGDLVQAEFADDSMRYRAVVREIHKNTMALVEFIDFGNTAMTQMSKMGRLHKSFLLLPMYSTHCMLSNVADHGKEDMLDPKVLSAIKEAVCGDGDKKLKCRFIRQSGSVWEVSLEDSGVNLICKVMTKCSANASESTSENHEEIEEKHAQTPEKLPLNSCPLTYGQLEFLEEQQLQSYISSITDALSFWCQSADTEELDKITSGVSEFGNAADHKHVDLGTLSPGSPCIVLFSDDHLWYRAVVVDTEGDKLSVLFVDYGNKSQVNITDVREMPPHLVEAPPQAFLCELEGVGSSCGSWDIGAVDELFTLTTDKLLQLTVTRVTREEENIKYFVKMECDGQVINEVMRNWWKCSTTENQPNAGEQCDSTVEEAALPEDQTEYPTKQEKDPDAACIHPQREHREDSPLPAHSDQSNWILSCDEDVCETNKGSEEEGASVTDTVGPDDENVLPDCNREETVDCSEILPTDLESSAAEMRACNMGSSFHSKIDLAPTNDSKTPIPSDISITSRSAGKMVPREAVCHRKSIYQHEMIDLISTDLEQIQTELLLPSPLLPARLVCDAPTEQDIAARSDVTEVPCIAPCLEVDLMTEDETLAPQQDTESGLLPSPQSLNDFYPYEPSDDEKLTRETEEDVISLTEEIKFKCIPEQVGSDVKDDLHKIMAKGSNEIDLMTEGETLAPQQDTETDPYEPSDDEKLTRETEEDVISLTEESKFKCIPIQTELLLLSPLLLAQLVCDAPTEQELAPRSDVTEVPCIAPRFEIDLMTEGETLAPQQDTESDPYEPSDDGELSRETEEEVISLTEEIKFKCIPEQVGSDVKDDLHKMMAKESNEIQTELLLPSPLLPAQLVCDAPTEQDIAARSDVTEVPCIAPRFEIDLMTEGETVAPQQDTESDPYEPSDDEKLTRETEEDVISLTEEIKFKCIPEQVGSDVKDDLHKMMAKASNEDNPMTEDETADLHEDKLSALSWDTKPQSSRQDMSNLGDGMTRFLAENCVKDVCRDQQQQPETETEQLVHSPPEQKDLELVTHLSLVVCDGSADLPVEPQPQ
ncbi:tudor domain-containing 6 [Limanda limanda]|uniref:tudor domain-containing 6 n=1 Tax=Limanda limanda TaxID=27771 RepID=UPI0029C85439|nr:tudor domain-containing 6 [Limanda limanda]